MKLELSPESHSLFSYISLHNKGKIIRGNFPDFLIVGPQRTGTTWLTENLRLHPELFLSFPKELYFFSRLTNEHNKFSLHYERFDWPLLTKKPKAFVRETSKVLYFDAIKTGKYHANELEWYLKFFEMDSYVKWKRNKLMKELYNESYQPKIFGEATASYAALPKEIIQEILYLNPDIKVILMVRDPVQRAWSHAKKDLVRNAYLTFDQVPKESFFEFFNRDYQVRCSQYSQQISNWTALLSENHFFLGEYNQIQQNPVELLLDIFQFLGINTDKKYISEKASQVINKTGDTKIPEVFKEYLENKFKEEKQILQQEYGISFNMS